MLQIQLLHTYYTHQQCAVLIRKKAHKQSHMHQQRQLSYNGSILLRCALCWQTQHLCTKLDLTLVQSAPPLWLINNAVLLECTMWEDAFLLPASTLWGLVHQLQLFYASTFRRLVRAPTTHCDWCVLKNFLLFIKLRIRATIRRRFSKKNSRFLHPGNGSRTNALKVLSSYIILIFVWT